MAKTSGVAELSRTDRTEVFVSPRNARLADPVVPACALGRFPQPP